MKSHMPTHPSLIVRFALAAATLAVLAGAAATAGCGRPAQGSGGAQDGGGVAFAGPKPAAPARLTLLAIDYSQSTERIRGQLLSTTFDIGTSFDAARDTFRLYRFGHAIEEVYSNLPEDDDAFAQVLASEVKASDPVGGTDYPRMLEALADAADAAPEAELRVVIVGDGENDFAGDPGFARRYRAAAARLARNPRLRWVRYWGVDTGTREEIRAVFQPLGRRLQILSLDQNPLAP